MTDRSSPGKPNRIQPEEGSQARLSVTEVNRSRFRSLDLEAGKSKEPEAMNKELSGSPKSSEIQAEQDADLTSPSKVETANQNYTNTPNDQDMENFGPDSNNQIDQAVEEQKEVLPESLVGK
jgi:hypothetical protein